MKRFQAYKLLSVSAVNSRCFFYVFLKQLLKLSSLRTFGTDGNNLTDVRFLKVASFVATITKLQEWRGSNFGTNHAANQNYLQINSCNSVLKFRNIKKRWCMDSLPKQFNKMKNVDSSTSRKILEIRIISNIWIHKINFAWHSKNLSFLHFCEASKSRQRVALQ